MFSERLPAELESNAFTAEIAELRRNGVPLVDLTVTNPTQVGLPYSADLLSSLADAAALAF